MDCLNRFLCPVSCYRVYDIVYSDRLLQRSGNTCSSGRSSELYIQNGLHLKLQEAIRELKYLFRSKLPFKDTLFKDQSSMKGMVKQKVQKITDMWGFVSDIHYFRKFGKGNKNSSRFITVWWLKESSLYLLLLCLQFPSHVIVSAEGS